jgi:ankyrin repeat protein
LLEIEKSNISDEVQSDFQSTVLYALEKAVEIGNKEAVVLLINYLSEEVISDYTTAELLIAAGKEGDLEIFDLLLGLKLTIDYSKNKVLESALEAGNPQVVKKLFDSGFKLPKQSYALESLMWSAFKYKKNYLQKSPEELFKLLRENGLKFSMIEERYRFILMDRVYTFAHAAWIDSSSQGINKEIAIRYKKAVITLTKTYINHSSTIDYQAAEKNQTLLMNAVDGNLPEVVELLLKHKPNLELKNENGKTTLDLATLEARIYILGSRKDFDKIYKVNAQKIVSMLGGDISPFKGKIK